jgi:hypothetical protein
LTAQHNENPTQREIEKSRNRRDRACSHGRFLLTHNPLFPLAAATGPNRSAGRGAGRLPAPRVAYAGGPLRGS